MTAISDQLKTVRSKLYAKLPESSEPQTSAHAHSANASHWVDADALLCLDDADFVRSSFISLFGREPDESGFSHFLHSLRTHALTKPELLLALIESDEGQAKEVAITGLAGILMSLAARNELKQTKVFVRFAIWRYFGQEPRRDSLNRWCDLLDDGLISREQLLLFLSESEAARNSHQQATVRMELAQVNSLLADIRLQLAVHQKALRSLLAS